MRGQTFNTYGSKGILDQMMPEWDLIFTRLFFRPIQPHIFIQVGSNNHTNCVLLPALLTLRTPWPTTGCYLIARIAAEPTLSQHEGLNSTYQGHLHAEMLALMPMEPI